ncbi:MAG: acylneuraminate cytidylyltransferase family protein [Patescibacteria group bacterium]
MKIYSLVQARGGSKKVPKKNIRLLGGYPLIAYSIAASKLCRDIQRTIVSTDSQEIADIAKKYGAEVPFLRPAEFAQDHSTDLDVFVHAINWLEEEGDLPDLIVQLRPTTPLREPSVMSEAIEKIKANPEATSLRSAHQVGQPPQKMFQVNTAGFWTGFFPDDPRSEYYNLPRQVFPNAYCPNGYVDVIRSDFIKNNRGHFSGPKILAFVTPFVPDIDQMEDFRHAEYILQKQPNRLFEYLSKNFPKEKNI